MAKACFSGCAAQYQGLLRASKGCLMALKPLTHGFDAYQEHAKPAEVPEEVQLPMLLASAPVAPAAPASPTSPAGDVPQAAQEKTPAEKTSQSYAEEMEPGEESELTTEAPGQLPPTKDEPRKNTASRCDPRTIGRGHSYAMAPKKLVSATTTTFSHTFCAENPGKLDEVYSVEKKPLGEGSYGQVMKGTHKDTGAVRAIKAINRHKISDPARFQVEVDIQSSLDHPNIVKLYEVFQDAKRFYLVMELCTGGELFERIVAESEKHDGARAFDERGAATYMQQILGAMSYLHKNNFVHRDIKPENFLMQNNQDNAEIKVIDFGLAKHYIPGTGASMKTRAGTPYYVAPQVLAGAYDEKCDIWSCGVICYILLCGYPPFYGEKDKEILARVKKGEVKFDPADWSDVSSDAIDFIKLMLTYDPNTRPSAGDLLTHKWLTASATAPVGRVAKDLGHKLKRFQSNSRMKKVALTLIAQQLKDDDLKELRETFIQLDKNRDGTLSLEEIQSGMKMAKADLPDDIVEIVKNLDTDGSGNIDYTEFMAATLTKKQYLRREVMWAAFRVFDTNGDGVITKDELAKILKEEDNMAIVEKMVADVDLDSNGEISFDEFCTMMEKDSAGILGGAAMGAEDRTLPEV